MSQDFLLVVALDFGTSHSGFAYKYKEDLECVYRDLWHDSPKSYPKTATHLLMSPDGNVEAWGYTAIKKLAELRSKGSAKDYSFLKKFKMKLHKGERDNKGIYTIENGQKFYVIDLIAEYIRLIKDEALQEIKTNYANFVDEKEIRWCLTIPAIWKDEDKDLMRRAAVKAGLIGDSEEESERLFLVLEPEAAAIFCQEIDKNTLTIGTHLMIVDCGGGTVDITVHKVVQVRDGLKDVALDEIVTGTGGAFGSTYVDDSFLDYLADKLTEKAIEQFQEKEPLDYLKMIEEWERTKCAFDPEKSGDIIYFPLGVKFYNLLKNNYPQVLKKLADEQNGDDTDIYISCETMEGIFKPTLDGIVQKVKEQFQELDNQSCDVMFLVGGFSTSPVLRKRMEQEFGNKVQNIVMPPRPGLAILGGAASFGVNPSAIRARCSRLTYGFSYTPEFEEGVDPESKRIPAKYLENSEDLCLDRFGYLVKKGKRVPTDAEITQIFVPVLSNQKGMDLEFFSTPRTDVRYTDDPSVTKLGELRVEMPFTQGGLNRKVEVTFYFGQTEIKVHAKDMTSGEDFKTAIRFNSGY
jgi:Molecular chaperone